MQLSKQLAQPAMLKMATRMAKVELVVHVVKVASLKVVTKMVSALHALVTAVQMATVRLNLRFAKKLLLNNLTLMM
mgnify:CR=1 FL=1